MDSIQNKSIWTEYTFVIRPSSVSGIGVFVTHDIPKGTELSIGLFRPIKVKLETVPESFRQYCIRVNETECLRPERFDRMEIIWYMNHSDTANIWIQSDGEFVARDFAACDIKAGDEVFVNYNQLNEPEWAKASYYKR